MTAGHDGKVGYGRPPKSSQFKKGRSGNPRGRPRNRKRSLPHDNVLGQMVTVREDGRERRITAAEAFILHLTKKGMEGDAAAARSSLTAIEAAKASRCQTDGPLITGIVIMAVEPGSVGCAASALRMVTRYGRGNNCTYKLNPWIVQKAVDRLENPISVDDQQKVWEVTKQPDKVQWPHWWMVRR